MRATLAWLWSGAVPRRREGTGLRFDRDRRSVIRDGRRVELTSREFSLLDVLLERKGETCSTHELAVAVWGIGFANEVNVVDAYVERLRGKLGDAAIETVAAAGYRLPPSTLAALG